MRHGSLFSGIGGFDLASEWMGWENVFHCEWNPFGQRVLKYYWPDAETFTDITKTDFTKYANKIDILTGGFPCQPYSQAGKRLGKEDERHLWPEMLRAIQEIQPKYIVGENVSGFINWNGGMVFNEVQIDLENQGYQVTPFILPACAVNAPHRRDRIWFIAYSNSIDRNGIEFKKHSTETKQYAFSRFGECIPNGVITNTSKSKLQGVKFNRSIIKKRKVKTKGRQFSGSVCSAWEEFPTQSPICDGDDGFSSRLDGITFSKWRNESIKAGGNAIVPQVALQIFKAIEEYERRKKNQNS